MTPQHSAASRGDRGGERLAPSRVGARVGVPFGAGVALFPVGVPGRVPERRLFACVMMQV